MCIFGIIDIGQGHSNQIHCSTSVAAANCGLEEGNEKNDFCATNISAQLENGNEKKLQPIILLNSKMEMKKKIATNNPTQLLFSFHVATPATGNKFSICLLLLLGQLLVCLFFVF